MAVVRTSGFAEFDKAVSKMGRQVDQATVTAMRAAAKVIVTDARANARVYDGPRTDVPKGRLKKSIKAGKIRRTALGRAVTVSPKGWPAHAYSGRVEELQPFMGPAARRAEAEFPAICEAAWAKAIL